MAERRAAGHRWALVAGALALAFVSGCKRAPSPPDAGVLGPAVVEDEDLGFRLELQPDWALAPAPAGSDGGPRPAAEPQGVERLAEARRLAPKGRSYLVAPKLVITAEPTAEPDLPAALRAVANDLRSLERAGARLGRTAQSTRLVGAVEVGELELVYTLGEKEASRELVHRTLVALRTRADGKSALWSLTATCLAEDAEQLSADLQQILGTLRFTSRAGDAAASPHGGSP